jgi:hypothetical protein
MISTCPKCRKQVTIPAGVDSAAVVRCPLCDAEYALGEAMALAPPELIPVAAAGGADSRVCETHHEATDGAFHAPYEEAGQAEEDTTIPPDIHEENEAAAVARQVPATSVSAQLRKRPSKSFLRTVFEVILGGLAGCLVAYYALALCFGSNFDKYLPKLPLPFISRLTDPPAGGGHPIEKPRPDNQGDQ